MPRSTPSWGSGSPRGARSRRGCSRASTATASPGSRGALAGYGWLTPALTDPARNRQVGQLAAIAQALGATPAQLAIAWCTRHPAVTSVIVGASQPAQLRENLRSLEIATRLSVDVMHTLNELFTDRVR